MWKPVTQMLVIGGKVNEWMTNCVRLTFNIVLGIKWKVLRS